ncbi:MAG: PP-loop family protein [Desulfovibrio sp.]|nr:PP-loop family protein [Desulfovibrio sp.]
MVADRMPRLAVAYSGGLDSRFLCFAASRAGASVLALHCHGPHIPEEETEEAIAFVREARLRLELVQADPLALPEVACGAKLRCYACKKLMLSRIKARLKELGEEDRVLCDGSNTDDLAVFRPGRKALEEEGVRSPLCECGIVKQDLLDLAQTLPSLAPSRPPRPCLLTRLAYGVPPSAGLLERLARAEAGLARLKDETGQPLLGDFRLRITPKPLLQAERFEDAWRSLAAPLLEQEGFAGFGVLAGGPVSGYFDREGEMASS